ncbi:hypothetical protein K8R04_02275 [Candidatus Uhrbacteria bacterium]|nr:hypothetical protein [Candidatus Uhrbacteria bacterium]
MQRASVRERSSQSVRSNPGKQPKTVLRVIDGGTSVLPNWQELLGLLLYFFAHRKKKQDVAAIPEKDADPAFFDEVPDTGVHEIPAYRPAVEVLDGEVTDERLDEILREAEPMPKVRFRVSGEKLKPVPKERKPFVPEEERDAFPKHVSSHALGQFARAYLKARGRLGEFIDRLIEARLGRRKADALDYPERLTMRRLERRAMANHLLRISRDEGQRLRDTQERLEDHIDVIHIARGPTKSFFLRFDPSTGVVLSFHSAQGFNRHKAYRHARKKSFREGGRRFH